ncbi:hypothetical protein FOXG_10947 [Fusarium oxysporum f. sp. lycopersici 4287]|uniref:C2H2-type domain-containing protein n=2 Tax=Fusarium oxysporum TaxID=5507 RepID=A0A0J9VJ64_FUSO4|nr:hypothetical protein FOXG_10947 [Fusarium oxysporum f. sp. lycopersici 4287]KNB10826.1 hypothetical protein FOXG_10947 [Fusarium oxysporum f. sp. lycopersici 4287]
MPLRKTYFTSTSKIRKFWGLLTKTNNQFPKEEEKQSPQFPSRSTTPSKRRRTAGFGDDLYDLDEDGDQSPNDSIKRFACPYFRKNPERHLECINLKMVRISDVKQHLKRRHRAPYPCPICSEGFLSLNLQGNHILQQTCSPGSGANWDSVSLASQKALQARFRKNLHNLPHRSVSWRDGLIQLINHVRNAEATSRWRR